MVVPSPTKSMLITLVDEPAVVTFRMAVAECINVPLVPVMLSVELPRAGPVTIVSDEFPVVEMEVGENAGVAPDGKPVTAKLTVPMNPLSGATVTV